MALDGDGRLVLLAAFLADQVPTSVTLNAQRGSLHGVAVISGSNCCFYLCLEFGRFRSRSGSSLRASGAHCTTPRVALDGNRCGILLVPVVSRQMPACMALNVDSSRVVRVREWRTVERLQRHWFAGPVSSIDALDVNSSGLAAPSELVGVLHVHVHVLLGGFADLSLRVTDFASTAGPPVCKVPT